MKLSMWERVQSLELRVQSPEAIATKAIALPLNSGLSTLDSQLSTLDFFTSASLTLSHPPRRLPDGLLPGLPRSGR
jgi:hypothetical protein